MALHHQIEVVNAPKVAKLGRDELVLLPYRPGQAQEWLPESMAKAVGAPVAHETRARSVPGARVACTHLGIWDEDTPAFLKACRDAVGLGHVRWLCDAHGVGAFFAGNWHAMRAWGPKPAVVIPGALVPQGFQELDQSRLGHVWILNTAGMQLDKFDVTGPRWYTLDPDDWAGWGGPNGMAGRMWSQDAAKSPMYFRLVSTRKDLSLALAVKARLEAAGGTCVVSIKEEGNTRAAANRAHLAASPQAAVEAYASVVQVAEPGTRAGVMRRLADFRKQAQ